MEGTFAFESWVENGLRTRELGAEDRLWLGWPFPLCCLQRENHVYLHLFTLNVACEYLKNTC